MTKYNDNDDNNNSNYKEQSSFEKLMNYKLVKKFETRSFINAFTRARDLSLSWDRLIQSTPPPIGRKNILIL
jgi:hypothetical protein